MNKDLSIIFSRISASDRVLDVGGWAKPFNRANKVIDIMPYENRGGYGCIGDMKEHFTKTDWIQRDLCDKEPWPFRDKEFDFVFCSHTLEDLRDPIWICSEINRVGKRGYIEVPSRGLESTTGIDAYPGSRNYAGYCHHRWLVELRDGILTFTFKTPFLHADEELRQFSWNGEKCLSFFWEGTFKFRENILLNYDEIKNDCLRFRNQNSLKIKNGNFEEKRAVFLNTLGEEAFNAKRFEEAKRYFERAREVAGDYVPAINNLGAALWQEERREEAFSCFSRAVQADATNMDALSNFISGGYTLGRFKEVENVLGKFPPKRYSKIVEVYRDSCEIWDNIFGNEDILRPDPRKVMAWRKYVESFEMERYQVNLRELCEYTGETEDVVKAKSPNTIPSTLGSDLVLAREWAEALNQGMDVNKKNDVADFYRKTTGYIYNLIFHDISNNQFSYHHFCMQVCKQSGMDHIFEFGAGIGSQAMFLKVAGLEITASDLQSRTRDFSIWCFERNGLGINSFILSEEEPLPPCANIISFDVLEHLVAPDKALRKIHNALQVDGKFLVAHACGIPDCSAGTHLQSNAKFGGENFFNLMQQIGFIPLARLTGFEGQQLALWEKV